MAAAHDAPIHVRGSSFQVTGRAVGRHGQTGIDRYLGSSYLAARAAQLYLVDDHWDFGAPQIQQERDKASPWPADADAHRDRPEVASRRGRKNLFARETQPRRGGHLVDPLLQGGG